MKLPVRVNFKDILFLIGVAVFILGLIIGQSAMAIAGGMLAIGVFVSVFVRIWTRPKQRKKAAEQQANKSEPRHTDEVH